MCFSQTWYPWFGTGLAGAIGVLVVFPEPYKETRLKETLAELGSVISGL